MPALVYLIGCPTHIAVGTDLFEVMISGSTATFTFGEKGRIEPGRFHYAAKALLSELR